MSKRSTILKIAGLDPIQERTHICDMAHCCDFVDCKHRRLHKPDEEECLIQDYCYELEPVRKRVCCVEADSKVHDSLEGNNERRSWSSYFLGV